MRVVVIEQGQRDNIWNQFRIHTDFRESIVCFISEETKTSNWNNIPVRRLEQLQEIDYDTVLIAIEDDHKLSLWINKLHERNISNIYIVRLYTLQTHGSFMCGTGFDMTCVDAISDWKEKPYLVHLETHVCDHCNLNCKACNNYAPFVKIPTYTDTNQFETDLRRLSDIYRIGRFYLLGGEPLLAPELCIKMAQLVKYYFPDAELRVLTNATLIDKMSSSFWIRLNESNAIVHISLYPPVKNYISDIENVLQKNNVTYLIFRYMKYFIKRLTPYPFEDAVDNNEKCLSAGCHYLQSGMLAKCPASLLVGNMDKRLLSNDVLQIENIEDAYKAISFLNGPCELCKNCSVNRQQLVEWEMVENIPQKEDWFIEDRLTVQNRQLEDDNKMLVAEIKRMEGINRHLISENNSIKKQNAILQEQNTYIREMHEATENEYKLLETKNESLEKRYKSIVAGLSKQLEQNRTEVIHIKKSISFRVGRALTWLPRKTRSLLKNIYDAVKRIAHIDCLFHETVMEGYRVYCDVVRRYGADVTILGNAIKGTGDYYICGQYLKQWLDQNKISNYVFLTLSGSQLAVTKLFRVYDKHTYIIDFKSSLYMRAFRGFAGQENQNFIFLDHQFPFPNNRFHNINTKNLMGFRGWNIHDFYLFFGFGFHEVPAEKDEPTFLENKELLSVISSFKGKTVLLSPYSESNKNQFKVQDSFWESIAQKLKNLDYTVYTNCAGDEKPIAGTESIFIPYINVVPFLDAAGYFIGFRSGLCDIISKSKCKKIIIHKFDTCFWPKGKSIDYTGVKNMELCNDAIELMMTDDNECEVYDKVINEFYQSYG